MRLDRVSIEVTQRCGKACWFCYSASTPAGGTDWTAPELAAFARDLAANGVRAVSFGGGEPLEWEPLFDVLTALRGALFRSITTNGLLLDRERTERLVAAAPDKVHVSIHFPGSASEVERVAAQVGMLETRGLRSGVNLLVARSQLANAARAARVLHSCGIDNRRIVYLPMRGQDTPTAREVAVVAGGPFQSMTCLSACARSDRFASVGWNRTAAWCSYTRARRRLEAPTFAALSAALDGLGLDFCGGTDGLVRLSRGAQHGHGVVRDRP